MAKKLLGVLLTLGLSLFGLTAPAQAATEPAFNAINVDPAWNAGLKGSGATVAIIDQGVNLDHPYFQGQIIDGLCVYQSSSGYRCPDGSLYMTGIAAANQRRINGFLVTEEFHGNMVAGIVAGKPNGSAPGGVAPEAKILMANVDLTLTSIVESLKYILSKVEEHNIVALSMSFGGQGIEMPRSWLVCEENLALKEFASLLGQLREKGVIPFAAAGNNPTLNSDLSTFPSCLKEAVAVGAVDRANDVSWYTTMSTKVELLAPDYTYTAASVGYFTASGTSAAAPLAAGSYAVLRQAFPRHNPEHVLDALKASGKPISDVVLKNLPLVDLGAAVALLNKTPVGTSPLILVKPVICKPFSKDLDRLSTYLGTRWAVYRVFPGCTGTVKVTLNGKTIYTKVLTSNREVKFRIGRTNTIRFYFDNVEQAKTIINL